MGDAGRRGESDPEWRLLCWATRATLVVALLVGLVVEPPQIEGKGWGARVVFYSLTTTILPGVWRLSRRGFAYSYLADALLVMPFTLDIVGNLVGFYDAVGHFDDALHLVNWMLLVGAFTVTVCRSSSISRLNAATLGTGFGATTTVLWETMEFLIMKIGGADRLFLTYEDTISDLFLSTLGGFIGSVVAVMLTSRRVETDAQP